MARGKPAVDYPCYYGMKLFDNEFKEWIDAHRNDDVASLRLRFASADAEVKEAISQIEYRA